VLAFIPAEARAQEASPVIITPTDGQILRGQVSITGTTDLPGFASAELDFAYASDSAGNWFLIQTFSQPTAKSTLMTWDTNSISDGDYVLRLRVALQDQTVHDAMIRIRVQNETPVSTAILTATSMPVFVPQLSTSVPSVASSTPTPPPFATPTAFPSNPVEVQTNEIYTGIQRGALVIVAIFVAFGILIRIRRP
jgi:hypothetical protein